MSRNDAVLIASRVVALYLVCWALDSTTYLPTRVLSLSHYMNQNSVLVGASYLSRYYLYELISACVRIVLLAAAAWWFYECGPRVQAFLLPSNDTGEGSRLPTADARP